MLTSVWLIFTILDRIIGENTSIKLIVTKLVVSVHVSTRSYNVTKNAQFLSIYALNLKVKNFYYQVKNDAHFLIDC